VPEGPTKIHENSGGVHQHLMSCAAKVLWHLGRSAMVVGEFFFVFLKESEVNALLKYRKVGRNHMFFYCSSIVSKKEYYEIHLFSENNLLHVVILLDTISGCSSDFIRHLSPFRLRMMSKATACPVAH